MSQLPPAAVMQITDVLLSHSNEIVAKFLELSKKCVKDILISSHIAKLDALVGVDIRRKVVR